MFEIGYARNGIAQFDPTAEIGVSIGDAVGLIAGDGRRKLGWHDLRGSGHSAAELG